MHPGLIGTAPSAELLAIWNKRETGLIEAHAHSVPPMAFVPLELGTYVGQDLNLKTRQKIHREGTRTIPGVMNRIGKMEGRERGAISNDERR